MAAQSSNRECPKDGATTTTTTKESSSTNNEGRPRSKSYQYYSTRKDGSNKMFTNQYLIVRFFTFIIGNCTESAVFQFACMHSIRLLLIYRFVPVSAFQSNKNIRFRHYY